MQADKTRFKDLFSGHADDYAKFRPVYPDELYQRLSQLAPAQDCAIDCGTGNGQAALQLAHYFKQVIAADPSQAQIDKAERHERIQYCVARAEALPVPTGSADLMTVAQALHWFQHGAFAKEVERILRPNGVLAAWGYDLTKITPEVDQVILHLYNDVLGPYWQPERRLVDSHYQTIKYPWKELTLPALKMTADWTLVELNGYLKTWSALQSFVQHSHDHHKLDQAFIDLRQAWGKVEKRPVEWPIFVRAWSI